MARKVNEIKAKMGFSKKPPKCGDCKHRTVEREMVEVQPGERILMDKRMRCGIGGFVIHWNNWCQRYEKRG